MRSRTAHYTKAAVLGLGLLMVAACGTREGGDATRGRQTASADTSEPPSVSSAGGTTATGAAPSTPELSDANIVALLDEANRADSAAGALAVKQATSKDVKDYARMMMGEHHALRMQGQQLAKKAKITPQPPADDPVKAAAQAEMQALQGAPKGEQFDRTYIEQEVTMHRMVLDLAKQAHGAADNAELKALIEKAQPVIEKHLARAEEIRKKLGGATS